MMDATGTNGTEPTAFDPSAYEQGLTSVVREMISDAGVYRQGGDFGRASEVLRWVNALSLMAQECGMHSPVQVLREQREARVASRKSAPRRG